MIPPRPAHHCLVSARNTSRQRYFSCRHGGSFLRCECTGILVPLIDRQGCTADDSDASPVGVHARRRVVVGEDTVDVVGACIAREAREQVREHRCRQTSEIPLQSVRTTAERLVTIHAGSKVCPFSLWCCKRADSTRFEPNRLSTPAANQCCRGWHVSLRPDRSKCLSRRLRSR